jgi:predicted DNA-binding transcriptional regulator AlpA
MAHAAPQTLALKVLVGVRKSLHRCRMIRFPANHPIGRQQRENLREKLFPTTDREELVRLHGELILPMLEKLLDAKIEELARRYEKAWTGAFATLNEDDGDILKSREEVAEMLGISLSSVQRLEQRGELPEPKRFGRRTVRHRLKAIRDFATSNGLPVRTRNRDPDRQ